MESKSSDIFHLHTHVHFSLVSYYVIEVDKNSYKNIHDQTSNKTILFSSEVVDPTPFHRKKL